MTNIVPTKESVEVIRTAFETAENPMLNAIVDLWTTGREGIDLSHILEKALRERENFKEALEFYAGRADDGMWKENRFIGFNKFGHVEPLLCGPYVAITALDEATKP